MTGLRQSVAVNDAPSGVPPDGASARAEVDRWSRLIARDAIAATSLVGQLKGNKAFIGQATRDYAGRFLYELLQNAYDAHVAGASGAAYILLDETVDEHGVLYVANAGKAFDYEDFRAISEIAQSSKQPGEGIGNKGVGFKSVLQVSEWPEIFSSSSASVRDSFDGYCFGFARPEDMLRLADDDSAKAAVLDERVSAYALPVPVDRQDVNVRAFAVDGMTSVCRLPLRSQTALNLARTQIREILASEAPVLLFLDRIGALTLEIRGDVPLQERLIRTRRQIDGPTGVRIDEVDLGIQGRFLVLERGVPHDEFVTAIQESIDAQLIDPAWATWTQEVSVSVAVRLDADLDEGRLYCFLPMGPQAKAPSAAHVNAPFAVRLARDDLIDGVPLNDLLFATVADACAIAGPFIRDTPGSERTVPDLLTWSTRLGELRTAFTQLGTDISKAPIIPILREPRWASLESAYHWDDAGAAILTAARIAQATTTAILDPTLGEARLRRILKLHLDVQRTGMSPDASTMAEWVELVARDLRDRARGRSGRFDPDAWLTFYDELSVRFSAGGGPLGGRKILIDDDLELQPCWGGEPDEAHVTAAIYFQARGDEADEEADATADVSIPASLRRYLAYMHSGLVWQVPNPQGRPENRPGRRFLESQSLVRPFRRQSLFERVRDILARSTAQCVRSDALRLVFNLANAGSYSQKPGIAELNLHVPTVGGWALATRTRFSASWLNTEGARLSRLIEEAGELSPELAGLSTRMLLPPDEWGFRADPEKWIPFLRRIGVKDGIWPTALRSSVGDYAGRMWSAEAFARWSGIGEADARVWAPAVKRADKQPWHRDTVYRSDAIVRIPGQSDFATFDGSTRALFGRLIAAGLGSWPASVESFGIRRPRHVYDPDEHRWPAPSWTFLETAAWVPVSRPGEPGVLDLAPPGDVWQFRDDGEAQPLFAPLLAGELRQRSDADPRVTTRLRSLGVRNWSDPVHAGARLLLLARLFEGIGVAESQVASFRKAYERSWSHLVANLGATPWTSGDQVRLMVSRRGQLGVFPAEPAIDERLYILGQPDRLAETLLGSLDVPVLRVDPTDGQAAAERLLPLLGNRIRSIAGGDFRVFLDGVQVETGPDLPLLVDSDTGWLVDLLALTLELKATQFNRQTVQTVRTAVERLRRVHLQVGRELHIELDEEVIDLPAFLQRVIAVPAGEDPVIAYVDPSARLDWSSLEQIAQPVADLVGQSLSGAELRLAIAGLARRSETTELYAPSDDDYSYAFGESIERVAEIRRGLRGVLDDLIHVLRPVVYQLVGVDLLALLATRDIDPGSDGALEALLEPYVDRQSDGPSLESIVAHAREAGSLAALRDALGLNYRLFNDTLVTLGRPYAPFHNAEGQRSAFAAHVEAQRSVVIDALRAAYLDAFDEGDDLGDYVAAAAEVVRAMLRRSRPEVTAVPALEPDPAWLDDFDLPPDELMDARLDAWLRQVGARSGGVALLPPIDDVRSANRRTLAAFVERARPIVSAWCGKRSDVDPPAWARTDQPIDLMDRFVGSGRFDFRAIDDERLIVTLARWDLWPVGMPHTLSLDNLGLTRKDLTEQQSAGDRARWLREQERRSVSLDGHRVSLEPSQVEDLIALVRDGITPDLLATPARTSQLEILAGGRRTRKNRDRDGGRDPFRGGRLSEAKAETIGFIGELIAYDWLVAQFAVTPASWVSSNRRFMFPDDAGDDGLGYDFQVPRRRGRPRLYEVKSSSQTDSLSFELTDVEIRTAQEHVGKGDYQVIFIRDVLNSATRSVHILPNPFDSAAQSRYRVVGTGIRYGFRLEQD